MDGQFIIRILKKLRRPATLAELIMRFARSTNSDPAEVKERVIHALDAAVRFGFVQKCNSVYYIMGLGNGHHEEEAEEEEISEENDDEEEEEEGEEEGEEEEYFDENPNCA